MSRARDPKREAWMREYLAAVTAVRGEWLNPLYRPHDFWDTAVFLYLSGKSAADAAAQTAQRKVQS